MFKIESYDILLLIIFKIANTNIRAAKSCLEIMSQSLVGNVHCKISSLFYIYYVIWCENFRLKVSKL